MTHAEAVAATTVVISAPRKEATTVAVPATYRPAKTILAITYRQAPMGIGIKTSPTKQISTGTGAAILATIAPGASLARRILSAPVEIVAWFVAAVPVEF
jgi:hypothetical protein